MGVVVLSSNYLVQFPINYFGLNEILTYGAFSYPIAFLITDLANRSYGKLLARQIVYLGFLIGIIFTLLFSTDFADLISVRIAIGSGVAFITAQLLDIQIFDRLRKKEWFVAPLTSSLIGSTVDTFLFFSISFSPFRRYSHFLDLGYGFPLPPLPPATKFVMLVVNIALFFAYKTFTILQPII